MEFTVNKQRGKKFYTDYVAHMIRFYLSNKDGINVRGLRPADISNWVSVNTVFDKITPEEKEILTVLYTGQGTYPEIMDRYCSSHDIEVQTAWNVVKKVSEDIARIRGLI